jgi:Zn-dependent protease
VPVFGLRFAVSLVVVLLVHELGHVAAAWCLRLPVRALLFIPFLGAVVLLGEKKPRIVEQDAFLALGGPAIGAAFAFGCSAAALATGNDELQQLGRIGALLNLLNLVPLFPLDGGRVLDIVSRRLCFVGAPIWGLAMYQMASFDMALVALVALPFLFEVARGTTESREDIAFYAAPIGVRIAAAAAYLVTVAVLGTAFIMAAAADADYEFG